MPPDSDHHLALDLRARGLEISDFAQVADFLRRVGFHRAETYCHPLLENPPGGRFRAGASFRHVAALCEFDAGLRHLSMDALGEIEVAVRAAVVRRLAEKDDLAHRRPELFRDEFAAGADGHRKWLERHDHDAARFGKDKMAPVWESAEWWSFSALSRLCAGMTFADRRTVSARFGDSGGQFTVESLHAMCLLRNTAAHHGRLWNKAAKFSPVTPKPGKVPGFNPPPGDKTRIYGVLCVVAHFIRRVRPDANWPRRLRDFVKNEFPSDAPGLGPRRMGFPDEWQDDPFWRE